MMVLQKARRAARDALSHPLACRALPLSPLKPATGKQGHWGVKSLAAGPPRDRVRPHAEKFFVDMEKSNSSLSIGLGGRRTWHNTAGRDRAQEENRHSTFFRIFRRRFWITCVDSLRPRLVFRTGQRSRLPLTGHVRTRSPHVCTSIP